MTLESTEPAVEFGPWIPAHGVTCWGFEFIHVRRVGADDIQFAFGNPDQGRATIGPIISRSELLIAVSQATGFNCVHTYEGVRMTTPDGTHEIQLPDGSFVMARVQFIDDDQNRTEQ